MKSSQEHLEGGIIAMPAYRFKTWGTGRIQPLGHRQAGMSHWKTTLSACPPHDASSGASSHLTPNPALWVFIIPILKTKVELIEECLVEKYLCRVKFWFWHRQLLVDRCIVGCSLLIDYYELLLITVYNHILPSYFVVDRHFWCMVEMFLCRLWRTDHRNSHVYKYAYTLK